MKNLKSVAGRALHRYSRLECLKGGRRYDSSEAGWGGAVTPQGLVRKPCRHGGRVLRLLYLCHRRRAGVRAAVLSVRIGVGRSEEHTSELQSLMRRSYAV